ncbi:MULTISPECIES: AAA family ATPase [Mycobacterium avium complex (MAC)]|uniref:Helicase n=1 Tax=Mycobacterium colombiense TaxID=339268 RepID=A0A329LFC1_9MYCO|nr:MULTISPECIES: AAA family ATPase [Mycobacterium avium complex (MAC)]OBG14480.1 helicase [Mycobacterium intracellulare]RAV05946.1 helicase [Mycobacterium colombiense]
MRTLPKRFTAGAPATANAPAGAPAVTPALPTAAPITEDWPGRDLLDTPMLARVLLAAWGGDAAVCVPACPGAGKSRLVALLAGALAHRVALRVAVAAQTREQAAELARRIAAVSDRASLIVSGAGKKPVMVDGIRTVAGRSVRWEHSTGGEILIGTAARWLYVDPNLAGADVLLVDEAWQCTYADLGALGSLARQVICVGDPGQVAPVVTGSTEKWEGQATGPHQPAPAALLAAHGDAITMHELTNSWRLGPQTCALLSQHFYPQMPFTSRRPDETVIAPDGTVLPEIVSRPTEALNGPTDRALLTALAERVRELTWHDYRRGGVCEALTARDIAVVVPHVAQAGAVRALLADMPDVLVGTVNALQGLERPAVVALHPMAGYRNAESFALDAGRMCVTLSRHRAHLTILTDPATAPVLDAAADDPQAAHARAVLAAI